MSVLLRTLETALAARARPLRASARGARRAAARGMTLIEIMVVLVILGLIAGAIGVGVFGQLREAQIKTAKLDIQAIENGVDLYHVETGNWPDSLQQLVPKQIKELRKDPWGNEYKFVRSGEGYDIYSYGPDKVQGGGDDITKHGGGEAGAPAANK